MQPAQDLRAKGGTDKAEKMISPLLPRSYCLVTMYDISMAIQRFTSVIKIRDGNPYILVGTVRAQAIKPGWRKPLPVLVRLNGKPAEPWRINMMPVGDGSFYLYLHGDVRKASSTKVNDQVESKYASTRRTKTALCIPCLPGSKRHCSKIQKR